MQKQVIILLGHGSKSKDAIEDFNYVVETTRVKSGIEHVYGAHFELAKPSLEELVSELFTMGHAKVIILPYFLYSGNHIKEDIPEIIQNLKIKYPDIEFSFGSPIGKDPLMAEIMLRKLLEIAS